ncbi:hypothetical protein PROFUN_04857 [Planoprotostelium fungivorum]|uniref:Uncharacterized protein n=1 Tax=Planoprotostelium fungivorum TaxID=1890364 RepID=A0A2P6NF35_9EUKA|nr:hypothetical protein PROFUN_04857 [Planoprotostelium fungivorum]
MFNKSCFSGLLSVLFAKLLKSLFQTRPVSSRASRAPNHCKE